MSTLISKPQYIRYTNPNADLEEDRDIKCRMTRIVSEVPFEGRLIRAPGALIRNEKATTGGAWTYAYVRDLGIRFEYYDFEEKTWKRLGTPQ